LRGFCGFFRDHWSAIASRTAVQLDEVGAAEDLVDRTLGALGDREQRTVAIADAQHTRQRAYTLFAKSYDESRRAVSFLRRHEGDADEIAPSLFAGRNAGSRSARETNGIPVGMAGATPYLAK
jgi:hypothetical protein